MFSLTICCSNNEHCDVFEGFGNVFAGPKCSFDLCSVCIILDEVQIKLIEFMNGNYSSFIPLMYNLRKLYMETLHSEMNCHWVLAFHQFCLNLEKLPYILIRYYQRFLYDTICIEEASKKEDYYRLGSCLGDIAKIFVMPL